jgi:hypothetical protein
VVLAALIQAVAVVVVEMTVVAITSVEQEVLAL